MRSAFITSLCEIAKNDKRIILLTGDLGYRFIEPFKEKFPKQFINVGVAEANLITVAAGLASTGKIPFCYSIATFATMRPFEQIRNDIALQKQNVKIVGIGAGLAYTKAGPTHHSMEDIGLMRLIPNMTIVAPANPDHVYQATKSIALLNNPCYMRLERNPTTSGSKTTFRLGRGIQIENGNKLAILITGTKVDFAWDIIKRLKRQRITPSLYMFETIKPIDIALIKKIQKKYQFIATLEEHRISGGFGTEVGEVILSINSHKHTTVLKYGLKNEFNPVSAGYEILTQFHGFTPEHVSRHILGKIKSQ